MCEIKRLTMTETSVIGKKLITTSTDKDNNESPSPAEPQFYQQMLRLEFSQKQKKKAVNQEPLPKLVKRALARLHQEDNQLKVIPKCDWPSDYTKIQDDNKKRIMIDGNKIPANAKEFDGYFDYSNQVIHLYENKKIVVRFHAKTSKPFSELKSEQVTQYLSA